MKKFSQMKNWNVLLVVAFVAAVVLLVAAKFSMSRSVSDPRTLPLENGGAVACTLDAKICPDGSAVGRQGPNCEFAACPGEEL